MCVCDLCLFFVFDFVFVSLHACTHEIWGYSLESEELLRGVESAQSFESGETQSCAKPVERNGKASMW